MADEEHVPIEKHEATDRFGKAALRAAHDIGRALAEGADDRPPGRPEERSGEDPTGDPTGDPARDPAGDFAYVEPVLVRRGGPHRSLAGLAALIDAALDEHNSGAPTSGDDRPPTAPGDPGAERRAADHHEDGDGPPAGADDAG